MHTVSPHLHRRGPSSEEQERHEGHQSRRIPMKREEKKTSFHEKEKKAIASRQWKGDTDESGGKALVK